MDRPSRRCSARHSKSALTGVGLWLLVHSCRSANVAITALRTGGCASIKRRDNVTHKFMIALLLMPLASRTKEGTNPSREPFYKGMAKPWPLRPTCSDRLPLFGQRKLLAFLRVYFSIAHIVADLQLFFVCLIGSMLNAVKRGSEGIASAIDGAGNPLASSLHCIHFSLAAFFLAVANFLDTSSAGAGSSVGRVATKGSRASR